MACRTGVQQSGQRTVVEAATDTRRAQGGAGNARISPGARRKRHVVRAGCKTDVVVSHKKGSAQAGQVQDHAPFDLLLCFPFAVAFETHNRLCREGSSAWATEVTLASEAQMRSCVCSGAGERQCTLAPRRHHSHSCCLRARRCAAHSRSPSSRQPAGLVRCRHAACFANCPWPPQSCWSGHPSVISHVKSGVTLFSILSKAAPFARVARCVPHTVTGLLCLVPLTGNDSCCRLSQAAAPVTQPHRSVPSLLFMAVKPVTRPRPARAVIDKRIPTVDVGQCLGRHATCASLCIGCATWRVACRTAPWQEGRHERRHTRREP